MYIIGLNASPFDNGNVATCLQIALGAAKHPGVTTNVIHLGQIPHDDGRRPEGMLMKDRIDALPDRGGLREVVAEILRADGIIFGTPTRNFTASSRVLALISWLQTHTDAPEYVLAGKVGGFMAVCEEDGAQSANEAMVSPCNHMGLIIPPFCTYFYNKFSTKSEGSWQEMDRALVGKNVLRMCRILRGEISTNKIGNWNCVEQ